MFLRAARAVRSARRGTPLPSAAPPFFSAAASASDSLYKVLGVSATATPIEIKAAFRARAKELHPDLLGAHSADAHAFLALVEAFETLSCPQRRRLYDASRASPSAAVRRSAAAAMGAAAAGPASDPAASVGGWRYGMGAWAEAGHSAAPAPAAAAARQDLWAALDKYRGTLESEFHAALLHAYFGPSLEGLAPEELPGDFEMDERRHPSSSEDLLHLTSGRTLLGVVRPRRQLQLAGGGVVCALPAGSARRLLPPHAAATPPPSLAAAEGAPRDGRRRPCGGAPSSRGGAGGRGAVAGERAASAADADARRCRSGEEASPVAGHAAAGAAPPWWAAPATAPRLAAMSDAELDAWLTQQHPLRGSYAWAAPPPAPPAAPLQAPRRAPALPPAVCTAAADDAGDVMGATGSRRAFAARMQPAGAAASQQALAGGGEGGLPFEAYARALRQRAADAAAAAERRAALRMRSSVLHVDHHSASSAGEGATALLQDTPPRQLSGGEQGGVVPQDSGARPSLHTSTKETNSSSSASGSSSSGSSSSGNGVQTPPPPPPRSERKKWWRLSNPTPDWRHADWDFDDASEGVTVLELCVGDVCQVTAVAVRRDGADARRAKLYVHGRLVAALVDDAVLEPLTGDFLCGIYSYYTPGVHHMVFIRPQRPSGRMLCRMRRAWKPPSAVWLFPPRTDTHDGCGWYVEWEGERSRDKPGWLHPGVYALTAALATLDLETRREARRQTWGALFTPDGRRGVWRWLGAVLGAAGWWRDGTRAERGGGGAAAAA